MAQSELATASCTFCRGHIAFERSSFVESGEIDDFIAGQTIICPHCQQETLLLLPKDKRIEKPVALSITSPAIPIPARGTRHWALPRRLLLTAGIVLSLSIGAGYLMWRRTPQCSFFQIRNGIEQHDFAKFQNHVDIDSVCTRAIDDLVAIGLLEAGDADGLGAGLGVGLVQLLKPRLVEEAKKQVSRFVETGGFQDGGSDTNRITGPFQEMQRSGAAFQGVGNMRREGKIAVLALNFTDATQQTRRTLDVKMRDMGGYWQVAELSNIKQLYQQAKLEEQQRRDIRNGPITRRMAELLKVETFGKRSSRDEYGIRKYVTLTLGVRNLGDTSVNGYAAALTPIDTQGKPLKSRRVRSSDAILPGHTSNDTWEFEVNECIPDDVQLYTARLSNIEVTFTKMKPAGQAELQIEE